MISIVIPLYNKEKQFAATLHSVFSQTYTDYEIIVVNDGSTDGSASVVESLHDPRIRLIHQANAGVSAARNLGISEARGEYIAFLDADDLWKPEYLETIVSLIRKYPDCDVFATDYEFIDSNGNIKKTIVNKIPFNNTDGILTNYFDVASCSTPPLWTSATVASKKALQTICGFPLGIKSGEDLLTWARLAAIYKIAYSRNSLAAFVDSPSDSNISKACQRKGGEDYILQELKKLYYQDSNIRGLKDYVLRWYKIYCVLLIEYYENHRIPHIAKEAIKFGGDVKIFIPLIIFGLMPSKLAFKLFYKLR